MEKKTKTVSNLSSCAYVHSLCLVVAANRHGFDVSFPFYFDAIFGGVGAFCVFLTFLLFSVEIVLGW